MAKQIEVQSQTLIQPPEALSQEAKVEHTQVEQKSTNMFWQSNLAAFLVANIQGQYTFANDLAVQLLGRRQDEIKRLTCTSRKWKIANLDGSPLPDIQHPFHQVMARGEAVLDCRLEIEHGDGHRLALSINAEPMRDEAGEISGVAFALSQVEGKQSGARLAQQLEESQTLLQVSQSLASSLDLHTTLQQIVKAAVSVIANANQAVIHLLDETGLYLRSEAVAQPDPSPPPRQVNFAPWSGIAGLVLVSGETTNVPDVRQDERFIGRETVSDRLRSLLVAPVCSEEKTIGTISVQSPVTNAFTATDERMLTTLGTQAGVAIEKARLLKTEREQRQMAEALVDVSLVLSTSLDFNTLLGRLLDMIRRVVPYDSANVMLIEDNHTRIACMRGYDQYSEKVLLKTSQISFDVMEVPYLRWMLETGQPVIVPNTQDDPGWVNIEFLDYIRSWAGAPIMAKGKVLAFFSLDKAEPGFYRQEHVDRLAAFAGQTGLVLQNAQLLESLQSRLKEADTLYQIGQIASEAMDVDSLLERVVNLLAVHFGYYHVQVYLINPENRELALSQASGPIGEKLKKQGHHIPNWRSGNGIIGRVALSGRPFMTNNVDEVPFFLKCQLLGKTRGELAVPLKEGDQILGVLDIQQDYNNAFKDHDVQLMATVAEQLAVAIQKANLYSNLQTTLLQEQATRAQLVQSEKLAALGRIVASVAHELNNPLQAIQNALYLVSSQEAIEQQSKDDLQVALNECNRMSDLIARLRETYRPTTGQEYDLESLNELVSEVERLISTHLRHNEVVFKFEPNPDLPSIPMIRDQIKQVILNICLNAVETMAGGGELAVTVVHLAETAGVEMTIADNGPGIPADVLPFIFDPFFTTKEGGTGLGLSITYDIVQRHDGKISVTSKSGEGTTFHVWLPLERARNKRRS